MLEEILKEAAEKICKKKGYHTPYELVIKPELPLDSKGRDRIAIIKAGNPPIICISRIFIEASVAKSTGMISIRDTLERCLDYLPKMYHTLSMVPIAQAIALRKDSRKWAKALVPNIRTELPDKHLRITNIAVTIEDTVTNTSVTRNGLDYNELVQRCKKDIARIVIQNEELEEFREMIEEVERVKSLEIKPNEVSVSIALNETQTTMEY